MKYRVLSFKYAIEGIITALRDEAHLKFHFLAAATALLLSWYLKVTKGEWLIIILLIGLVIGLELTNTAIEELVNSFTEELHPSAKKAKDVAAGAVLVVSIAALLIGVIIFLPYLSSLLA
jgi:undecaprenol kinase